MRWSQIDQYHWRRDDSRYFIDHAIVRGASRYTAWFKAHEGAIAESIGCRDTLHEAVELTKHHKPDAETTAQEALF